MGRWSNPDEPKLAIEYLSFWNVVRFAHPPQAGHNGTMELFHFRANSEAPENLYILSWL
jgi:hypothetical protein